MSDEKKALADTEELTNTAQNLDKQLNEEPVVDDVKFGSDKEEVENISTEILPPEPQKPNAKKILAKSKEELEEELKVSLDREKYLKDTKDEMFKSFEKKGNVYFLEGKTAIKVENYTLGFNKDGVKRTSCSPHSSPLVFAKSLSDVKVKHISNFPIVEGSLENLEQALLLIQEKDLFDLNEITIGKDVDDSVKEMLERLKNKNNVELGLDNKKDKTAKNDDEGNKQDQTKPSDELTDNDIANFGDDNAYELDSEEIPTLNKSQKQLNKDIIDELDSNISEKKTNDLSLNVDEVELDFDEDKLEADSSLDLDDDVDNVLKNDSIKIEPENSSLKPTPEKKKTASEQMDIQKNSLLAELKNECKSAIKTSENEEPKHTNKNTKASRLSSRPK